jgi:hypothetical protein
MLAKIEGGDCEWMQHAPIAIPVRSHAGAGRRDHAAVSRLALFQRRRAERVAFTEQVVNRVRADETTVK